MSEGKTELNLYQKIVEVRKIAEGFSKDKSSYGYSYVSGNQVLGKIKDKMNELNLLLFPSTKMGEHHTHAYKTAKGKDVLDFVVKGEMSYTWINGDNPTERETVEWAYYGQQDDISKAYGSALTYSERYYLLKSLGLPTDEDDPDAKQEKPSQQTQHPSKPYQAPQTTQQPQTSGSVIDLANDAQSRMIFARARDANVSMQQITDHVGYEVKETKQIHKTDVNKVLKLIDTLKEKLAS